MTGFRTSVCRDPRRGASAPSWHSLRLDPAVKNSRIESHPRSTQLHEGNSPFLYKTSNKSLGAPEANGGRSHIQQRLVNRDLRSVHALKPFATLARRPRHRYLLHAAAENSAGSTVEDVASHTFALRVTNLPTVGS